MKICWICGSTKDLKKFGGEIMCKECAKVIARQKIEVVEER